MNEEAPLWKKNLTNLTVGDAIKLNVYVTAGIIGIYAGTYANAVVCKVMDKLARRKQSRELEKLLVEN